MISKTLWQKVLMLLAIGDFHLVSFSVFEVLKLWLVIESGFEKYRVLDAYFLEGWTEQRWIHRWEMRDHCPPLSPFGTFKDDFPFPKVRVCTKSLWSYCKKLMGSALKNPKKLVISPVEMVLLKGEFRPEIPFTVLHLGQITLQKELQLNIPKMKIPLIQWNIVPKPSNIS